MFLESEWADTQVLKWTRRYPSFCVSIIPQTFAARCLNTTFFWVSHVNWSNRPCLLKSRFLILLKRFFENKPLLFFEANFFTKAIFENECARFGEKSFFAKKIFLGNKQPKESAFRKKWMSSSHHYFSSYTKRPPAYFSSHTSFHDVKSIHVSTLPEGARFRNVVQVCELWA